MVGFFGRAAGDVGGEVIGLEARRKQLGRAAHHLVQLRLAQRRHFDTMIRLEQPLIVLQRAGEIRPQTHQRAQTRVRQPGRENLGEARALARLGTHVELLALVHIDEEGGRLGLPQLLVTPLGRVQEMAKAELAFEEPCHPLVLPPRPQRIGGFEPPGAQEFLDQRLDRFRPRPQREETPAAAVAKRLRPCACDALGRLRPVLARERGERAGLRERGLADAGIADQDRQPLGARLERPDHLDGLARPPEEEIAVGFRHGGEAAIRRGVPPQLARPAPATGDRNHQFRKGLLGSRVRCDDPMQLPQERQAGRGLAVEQHEHHREGCFLHAPVDRLAVFGDLPGAEPPLADQQNEGRRLGDFLGEFRKPIAAGAQALGREKDVQLGILAPQRRLERLHQREVLRIVAQEPATHSEHRAKPLCIRDRIRGPHQTTSSANHIGEPHHQRAGLPMTYARIATGPLPGQRRQDTGSAAIGQRG